MADRFRTALDSGYRRRRWLTLLAAATLAVGGLAPQVPAQAAAVP